MTRPNRPCAMWGRLSACGGLPGRLAGLAFLVQLAPLCAQTVDLVPVVSKPITRTIDLPAEILPYLTVSLHAKVPGYVERVLVDRGSIVKQGDLLAELSAPELKAQIAEGESKVQAAESEKLQAQAQLAAAESTYAGLRKAAETPGAVAGNEVVQLQKQVEAAQSLVRARDQASQAAAAALRAQKDMEAYLKIAAPFDGVVTDRLVHPGALVGPGADPVLLVIQQISRLRLVVPVPEEDLGGMVRGASISFRVPAYPDRAYTGTVARIAHALDPKTRTMPVELEVVNRDGTLAPGMYPSVKWPVRREHPALFVPKTSVVTTTERTFVIRARGGRAEWVDVKKGAAGVDLIEVSGALAAGDRVVRRGTDELRDGMPVGGK
ncbi:MAG: efflux RND transporter periplasmic adaptor subunit [Bryobacteraceae bacterium]